VKPDDGHALFSTSLVGGNQPCALAAETAAPGLASTRDVVVLVGRLSAPLVLRTFGDEVCGVAHEVDSHLGIHWLDLSDDEFSWNCFDSLRLLASVVVVTAHIVVYLVPVQFSSRHLNRLRTFHPLWV